jgi:hypothetical protein
LLHEKVGQAQRFEVAARAADPANDFGDAASNRDEPPPAAAFDGQTKVQDGQDAEESALGLSLVAEILVGIR